MMQRRDIAIGKPDTVRTGLIFLALWGVIGLITICMAASDLPLP